MQISGSNVLLTGASGGLGQAIARSLAAKGANLILTGRRLDVLEPLASELGGRAIAVDLSDRDEVQRLAQDAGAVDILIANAALPGAGTLVSFTAPEADRVLEVNLRAPIALTHALSPGMMSRGRGHLVFVSSTAGKVAAPGNPLYHATKFGLRGFAAAMRIDLQPSGVGVSGIFPGFIRDAGLFADSGAKLPRGVGTRSPEDVARAVIRAIERDRPEVDVAPPFLLLGSWFARLAPDLAASIARRMGSEEIARTMDEGLRAKR